MRLIVSRTTEPIQIEIEDQPATSCKEIRPGVRVHLDERGNMVGVEILPSELAKHLDDPGLRRVIDEQDRMPLSPFGERIRDLRDRMWAEGYGPLTEEEFDRELAERRGG